MVEGKSSSQIEIQSATQSEKQADRKAYRQADRDSQVNRQTIKKRTEIESLKDSD